MPSSSVGAAVLVGLSIRQIVLVDRLDLELSNGLCVVTGETGAGKSVLLDALGLALGERADSGLIRPGVERGWVSASFELGDNHPVLAFLEAHGLRSEASLLLRRTGAADGRSRAFVNDQPVSVGLLRQLGKMLVEIHGQANHADLTDPANQLAMLDSFGGLAAEVARVGEFFDAARRAEYELTQAQEGLASAQADEEYMRHALGELEQLAPTIGEEQELAATRRVLMESDRLLEALDSALALLAEDGGPRARLVAAERALSSVASAAAGRLGGAMAALSQASIETEEATTAVVAAAADLRPDPERLEQVEERLFALRALARKHRLEVDGLPELRRNLVQQLAALDAGTHSVEARAQATAVAREEYRDAARSLSVARQATARRLDVAITNELEPLKLGHATFETRLEALAETQWTREGMDRVAFNVTTIPGAPPGPLGRIASGGELSRLTLALKVVLSRGAAISTLIFDEVDRDVGGATAESVGQHLAALATQGQVIAITHSAQVAARANHHWRVTKRLGVDENGAEVAETTIELLDAAGRREEVARLLAGARITPAARAAADSLIGGHGS